jgi:hypothetical protein
VVHLVEVDLIGLQPPQAVFAGPADVMCREVSMVGAGPIGWVDLGREHDPIAPAALRQPAADDVLQKL